MFGVRPSSEKAEVTAKSIFPCWSPRCWRGPPPAPQTKPSGPIRRTPRHGRNERSPRPTPAPAGPASPPTLRPRRPATGGGRHDGHPTISPGAGRGLPGSTAGRGSHRGSGSAAGKRGGRLAVPGRAAGRPAEPHPASGGTAPPRARLTPCAPGRLRKRRVPGRALGAAVAVMPGAVGMQPGAPGIGGRAAAKGTGLREDLIMEIRDTDTDTDVIYVRNNPWY